MFILHTIPLWMMSGSFFFLWEITSAIIEVDAVTAVCGVTCGFWAWEHGDLGVSENVGLIFPLKIVNNG